VFILNVASTAGAGDENTALSRGLSDNKGLQTSDNTSRQTENTSH